MAGPGAQDGDRHRGVRADCSAEHPPEPVGEGGVEPGGGRPALPRHLGPQLARAVGELLDECPHLVLLRAAGVEPAGDVRGDGVDPARGDGHLADRGHAAPLRGDVARPQDEVGIPEHGVAAVLEAGGAGVVGLAGEVEAPAPVRPDVAGDGDRRAEVDERAPLLDVQLDERADPTQGLLVRSELVRVAAGRAQGLGVGGAVGVGEREGPLGGQLAGQDPGAGAGDPEAGALLVDEVDHRQGHVGRNAGRAQGVDGRERRDHAEGSVEGTAVGHRVQVRADRDPGTAGRHRVVDGAGAVPPPGPLVADAVDGEVQAAAGALGGEPLAQGQVLGGPGEPPVAARRRPPHRLELGPHGVEGRGAHRVDCRRPVTSAGRGTRGMPSRIRDGPLTPARRGDPGRPAPGVRRDRRAPRRGSGAGVRPRRGWRRPARPPWPPGPAAIRGR